MNLGVLIAVIAFEVISILGLGIFISRREKDKKDQDGHFAFAGGGLPTSLVGVTLALTLLGSAHNWGTCQNAYDMGVIAAWFGIACAIMMVVITQITGPWIRKTGSRTVAEFFEKIFGEKVGLVIACVNTAIVVGMLCLEVETIAVTFAALTGWSYTAGAVVGGIFGIAYVMIAGMKEIAWLNMLNAIVMYIALIVVFICLCFSLPGGWDNVQKTMEAAQETSWMTNIFGNSDLIIAFAVPSALGASLFHGFSQMGFQPVATAKDNKTVKKSIWLSSILNGCFCIVPALIGVAAASILAYNQHGSMMATPMMLVDLLPKPVLALLMASFLGVDLSTFAICALAPATLVSHNLYTTYKKDASEKEKTRVSRICILVFGILAIAICNFQPAVVDMVNWCFAFGIPLFVMAVIGLWWKRSAKASLITFFVTWVCVCIWSTFGLQATLGMDNLHVTYISTIISIVVGVITSAVLPGKVGLFKAAKAAR